MEMNFGLKVAESFLRRMAQKSSKSVENLTMSKHFESARLSESDPRRPELRRFFVEM
jgi:hypothetical protein